MIPGTRRAEAALLPCPFCGSAEIDIERSCTGEIEVQCLGECGALIVASTRERAIALWNSRSITSPDAGRIEAVTQQWSRCTAQLRNWPQIPGNWTWDTCAKNVAIILAAVDAYDAAAGIVRVHGKDTGVKYRHVKRGTEYTLIGNAQVQCADSLTDYEVVVVYRDADGQLWVRRHPEFHDGRFARTSPPPDDGGDAHEPCPDEEVEF